MLHYGAEWYSQRDHKATEEDPSRPILNVHKADGGDEMHYQHRVTLNYKRDFGVAIGQKIMKLPVAASCESNEVGLRRQ